MMLDVIPRGMKSVGKIAKVTRFDKILMEMVVNRPHLAAPRGNCRKEWLFWQQEGEK
jgi:hypothetical protein